MRKFSIGVRHYWAKTVDCKYGGLHQQLVIELFIAILMLILTVYCAKTPGLELFYAGFIIPTIIFTVGMLPTLYYMIVACFESQKYQHDGTSS